MTNINIFEAATKNKLRFPYRGLVSVEDLWDLSTTNLDSIFKVLNSEFKQAQEESLLNKKTKEDKELDVKIEIVKYIFEVKTQEQIAKLEAKQKREMKQKIMEEIEKKKDESIQNKTAEELEAMLKELDN